MKKLFVIVLSALLFCAALTGCQGAETSAPTTTEAPTQAPTDKPTETPTTEAPTTEAPTDPEPVYPETVNVGSLKGPTTMGLVNLMKAAEKGESNMKYVFTMETQADAIATLLVSGKIDIALIPANLAAVLNNKTNGGIVVLDINTLGVLYCVTGDETVKTVKDLAGREVIMTGQGTTPEYALRYLLDKNGITDCTLTFKSEATEVAAVLAEDPKQVAVLPQPFVTSAIAQNEALKAVFSLSDAWDEVAMDGSRMLTGVTVARKAFVEEYPDAVAQFLEDHAASTEKANTDLDGTSELIAEYGIIPKAPLAKKALPQCNIVCITGEEMKTALTGYLTALYEANPASVGGTLPTDEFFYLEK
ncbi:MAG: ABC transporter substrate-binding protein [Lachnospiraceae bacterium]|nr:ABC transporter substrate-binding protein [Lachnospiraceae bacterium]